MSKEWVSFTDVLSNIVDNRGRTCPVGDTGIPLIATNCVDGESMFPTFETTRFVGPETYQNWFRDHPKAGDILFVCKGSPGRTALVPDPVPFCIAQDMVAVRPAEGRIYPRYLFAALRSKIVQDQIANMHVGTMIPHFKKGDFGKLLIPVVDTRDQVFIGDLYFELTDRIRQLREIKETLETIAQALFQSWFVDFDPVRAKSEGRKPEGMDNATAALFPDSFEDSPLGPIPTGWRNGRLADLASLNPESWTGSQHPDFIRYVDLANTKANRIDMSPPVSFSDAPSRARRVLRGRDTIVGTVRPGNRSYAYIFGETEGLTGSTGFAVLRPKNNLDAAFVYLGATSASSIDKLAHAADGAAYPAVRPESVGALAVSVGPRPILDAFGSVVNPLLEMTGGNELKAKSLAGLRDSLLPRLISGQMRVSIAGVES